MNTTDFFIKNGVLVEYRGEGGEVIIPSGVIEIGEDAFRYKNAVVSIVVPEGVRKIGIGAFCECKNLRTIELPNTITQISEYMLDGCENLEYIQIPNSVIDIGNYAFYECKNIKHVIVPEKVTRIGAFAFSDCYLLERVELSDNVVSIGEYAFTSCENLEGINIPSSVIDIGDSAFAGCTKIEYVIVPEKVTRIGPYAFANCDLLEGVELSDNVVSIGEYAFDCCKNLKNITIPKSITSVEAHTFSGCVKLKSVRIPNSVTSIGDGAFFDCEGLMDIVIPSSVNHIGQDAFVCSEAASVDGDEEFARYLFETRTIYAPCGSYAEQYAKTEGIIFKTLEDDQLTRTEKSKELRKAAVEGLSCVYTEFVWKISKEVPNTFVLSGEIGGGVVRKAYLAGCHDVGGGEIYIDYNPDEDIVGINIKDRPIQEKFKEDLMMLIDKHSPFGMQLSFDDELAPILTRRERVEPRDFAKFFEDFRKAYEENYPLFYMISVSAKEWYDGFSTKCTYFVDGVYY